MIFGRKKAKDPADPETEEHLDDAVADETEKRLDDAEVGDEDDETPEEVTDPEARRWTDFDASQDWREDGPYDASEVDLSDDSVERLDFGSLVITPMGDSELRLQVDEQSQQILSALLVHGDSALELSAFAAPRTPGMWADIRADIMAQTQEMGGIADCVEGPFGTELVRNVPVQTPDGQRAFQASRTWVVEGPRWLLRGVLYGQASLTDEVDSDLVGPFFDAFCDVIVRRGDAPMPVGDILPLTIPPELQAAQAQE